LYESDVNFLFIRASVHRVYNKIYVADSSATTHADAWNFSTLFLLACHMVGFIFVWIWCQLPVYPCICPYNVQQIFIAISLATTHHRCLKFWYTLWYSMPYGGIYFCMIPMTTSCLSLHLSIECINMRVIYSHQSGGISSEYQLTGCTIPNKKINQFLNSPIFLNIQILLVIICRILTVLMNVFQKRNLVTSPIMEKRIRKVIKVCVYMYYHQ
jgi:hypothetical protein